MRPRDRACRASDGLGALKARRRRRRKAVPSRIVVYRVVREEVITIQHMRARVRLRLAQLRMTFRQLAERSGLQPSHLSEAILGRREMTEWYLHCIEAGLGVGRSYWESEEIKVKRMPLRQMRREIRWARKKSVGDLPGARKKR